MYEKDLRKAYEEGLRDGQQQIRDLVNFHVELIRREMSTGFVDPSYHDGAIVALDTLMNNFIEDTK